MSFLDPRERERAQTHTLTANFYDAALEASKTFRKGYAEQVNIVKAADMPFERSRHGLIKHIINEQMNTKEYCLDIYMQFLPVGKASGKHRHLSEEVFYVVEGSGYDLHWDVRFDCKDVMEFEWDAEPRKFEWKAGDFVYIPPYVAHQHFNADPANETRIIVVNSRIVKAMGFDWFEQIEDAQGY